MAQQINLYNPILLAPRRYFSALAMVQALGVLALGLALLSAWSVHSTQQLRADLASAIQAEAGEKQRLEVQLAGRPAPPRDTTAIEQELAQALKQLAERQGVLAALSPAVGQAAAQRSALLTLLAQTVPAPVWLTEVRMADGRVELMGMTLQPEALRPWLAALSAHPALAGQSLRAVKVERREDGAADAWSFQVLSSRAGSAGASQGNVALPLSLIPAGDGRLQPALGRS
jgi:Tfp pilus assembly protein PilN